ncbi:MAG: helix-turn-helix transcriptional regulator, partial [Pseudonocardiales bacterium]
AGNYDAAATWIARARELGEQLATGLVAEAWLAGMLDLYRGNIDAAEQAASDGLRLATDTGNAWARRLNLHLGGLVAAAAGHAAQAADRLAELAHALDEVGLIESFSCRFEPDWVEACVAIGDLDTAALAQARLVVRHRRLPRPWTSLGVARGAVLIAAAAGEPTEALLDDLAAARRAVPADIVPFDRARCLLVAGIANRRARRKAASRAALEAAAAEFDAIGARSHAERARSEASRIGGRPAASQELSSTEAQVAGLAARGATNRSIADTLFVSPKTVEANLARVYRKLGIRSRAELGAALSARAGGVGV